MSEPPLFQNFGSKKNSGEERPAPVPRKRRRELALHTTDGIDAGEWAGGGPTLEEIDNIAMKQLQREKDIQKNEVLEPEMPPMFMWPKETRDEYMNNIAFLAQAWEKRAIRPHDPATYTALRQNEAALAPTRAMASVSLYSAQRVDPHYANNPLSWGEKPKYRRGITTDHKHSKEQTVVLEIRNALDLPAREPVPDAVRLDENFSLAPMPEDCLTAVHSLDTYIPICRFARHLHKTSDQPQRVADTLADFARGCRTQLFCVRFIDDNATIEMCFYMEAMANYFAVLAFKIALNIDDASRGATLRKIREQVCSEIETMRRQAENRMADPFVTEAGLADSKYDSNNQLKRELWLRDEKQFHALADRYHVDFASEATSVEADKQTLEIAQFCPLAIFAPDKSTTLANLPCKFLYHYFTTCQCLMMDSDEEQTSDTAQTSAPSLPRQRQRELNHAQTMIDKTQVNCSVPLNFKKEN